jgi:hypothetical protein
MAQTDPGWFDSKIEAERPTCWRCSWVLVAYRPALFALKVPHAQCPEHSHLATGA